MAKRKKDREINVFGVSFMDVLSNTVGGLAFLLIIVFLLMIWRPDEFKDVTILTESLPEATVGKNYDLFLSAEGGGGIYSWEIKKGKLPEGLKFDREKGHISGSIQKFKKIIKPVTNDLTVSCMGSDGGNDLKSFILKIQPADAIPAVPVKIFSGPNLPSGITEKEYPLALSCKGGTPPYKWTIEEGSLPSGMFLKKNGKISGRTDKTGTYSFKVGVLAGNNTSDSAELNLKIEKKADPPPPGLKIITKELPDASVDHKYPFYPAAEGGYPPYRWKVISGKPKWMKSDSSGNMFHGTPTYKDLGQINVVLKVTDSRGASLKSEKLSFKVMPPGAVSEPLELLTDMLPDAVLDKEFSFYPASKGGYYPIEWSCDGLKNFPGLKFDPKTGHVHGVPKAIKTSELTFMVSDDSGKKDSITLKMNVSVPEKPLNILSEEMPLGLTETDYSVTMSATGGHPPYKWSLASGAVPEGMNLNAETGEIKGIPGKPGNYVFVPKVTDAHGNTKQGKDILFKVWSRQQRPELVMKTDAIPTMVQNEKMSVALSAEGGLPPYNWSIDGELPQGIECEKGFITGSPEKTGNFMVKLNLKDAEGQNVSSEIKLSVKKLWPWWWVLIPILISVICLLIALKALRRVPLTPVKIVTEEIPNARASCKYKIKLACEGGCAPYKWKLIDGELPPGMELSEAGFIEGTPFSDTKLNETIESRFTVEVKDARGQKDKREL